MQVLANALLMLNYWLLDAFSGATIALIAIAQTVIMFIVRLLENKMSEKTNTIITIIITTVFAVIFIVSAIKTYKAPIDILSALASMAFCFCIVQKNASVCRIFALANSSLWIGYDIGTFAWTTILTHGFSFASALIGIIRLDFARKIKRPLLTTNNKNIIIKIAEFLRETAIFL